MDTWRAEVELRVAAAAVAEARENLVDAERHLAEAAARARAVGVPHPVIDPLLAAPYRRTP